MLAPDPGYEAWVSEEGLDGATDWHVDDHPFLYTAGWDFPTVNDCPDSNACIRIEHLVYISHYDLLCNI